MDQVCKNSLLALFADEMDDPCHGKKQEAGYEKQDADCSVCFRPAWPEEFRCHKVATERQKPQLPENTDCHWQAPQHQTDDQKLTADFLE